MSALYNRMQYPVTSDSGNLYPTPPPNPGFPVATNFGDYIYYNGADWTTGDTKITLGGFAGQTNQQNNAVALGYFAGTTDQGEEAVAIGHDAANSGQGVESVAIGHNAAHGSTGTYTVAVGANAAYTGQNNNAVAIGSSAGNTNQGFNAVAVGAFAGVSDQASNTIILNATGGAVNGVSGQGDSLYVAPVRDYGNANTFSPMGYDPSTKEIGYASPRCGIHQCIAGTTQIITITGLTSDGIVGLTYIHPPGGGAGQYFQNYTASTNSLLVELGQVATTAESIIWIVGKL